MVHLLRWIIRMLYIVITHQMLFSLLMKDVGLLNYLYTGISLKNLSGLRMMIFQRKTPKGSATPLLQYL